MGKKNENINLWLLEEQRRKDRAHALIQASENPEEEIFEIQEEETADQMEAFPQEEIQTATQKIETDFEQLDKEKELAEKESKNLDKQIEGLNQQAKAICEKIVHELEKRNTEKRQAVKQLQERVSNLEAQLATPSTLILTQ